MKLIAFTGPKYSGKTTAADTLMKLVQYPHKMSFAYPIKQALLAMGFTREEILQGDKEEPISPFGASCRRLCQTLGTDWGRNMVHKDIWLMLFARQFVIQERSGTQLIVIDDVRFDNEADMIKSLGGIIIKLEPHYPSSDSHPSERGIDPKFINHTIPIQPSAIHLCAMVRELYQSL